MASRRSPREFDSEADETPLPANQLSANGQWFFGALYAGLALVGFSFGVWAGASKPKIEVVEAKKEPERTVAVTPTVKPSVNPPVVTPVEPKAKEKVPEPVPEPKKEPEPTPEPKKKDPEPEPKKKEPEPKKVDVKPVAFKEVAPLFVRYCNDCHNSVKPKKGVDLTSVAAIMKGGTGGEVIKPGSPDKSSLYLTMISDDDEVKMPPPGKPKPTAAEIKLIHDWIASGAKPRRTVRRKR